jgi:hypothetical protein
MLVAPVPRWNFLAPGDGSRGVEDVGVAGHATVIVADLNGTRCAATTTEVAGPKTQRGTEVLRTGAAARVAS